MEIILIRMLTKEICVLKTSRENTNIKIAGVRIWGNHRPYILCYWENIVCNMSHPIAELDKLY